MSNPRNIEYLAKHRIIECHVTEDGEPWGVFAYGHIDRTTITLEMVNHCLADQGVEPLDEVVIEHLYIHQDPEGREDGAFFWCEADSDGAIAVTGVQIV